MCCSSDIFLALLAILFPPIAVWVKSGLCSADSLINIALCILGYIPGLLHAWYIIAKNPEPSDYDAIPNSDSESHVTYYYVSDGRRAGQAPPQQQPYPHQSYGTVQDARVPPHVQQQRQQQGQQQGEQGGQGGQAGAGASQGAGGGVPPSYEQAVRGDHKVQS